MGAVAAWVASVAALLVLSLANGNFQRQPLANTVGLLLAFAAFMGVGALIVAHRLVRRLGLVPDGGAGLVFTPLLFPDGRPPSPSWRLVAWLTAATTALFVALTALQPPSSWTTATWSTTPSGSPGPPALRTASSTSRSVC